MAGKIVLVSDDSDFFDYIRTKLELRKSDELFTFSFDDIPGKLHLLSSSVLIINSENSQDKTLALLKILKGTPSIVSAYNDDEVFKRKCYREGMFDFITLLTPDADFRARMLPVLGIASLIEKNKLYRDILVKNNIVTKNNEIFTDYNNIIDNTLDVIKESRTRAVFGAISPNDKTKFLITSNTIETILLNNIRKNDIVMNYAPNKYFILLLDTSLDEAELLWNKINSQISDNLYAGFVSITNQKRAQLIDSALNKLHDSINRASSVINDSVTDNSIQITSSYNNFKLFKQNFEQKIENTVAPVFYQIQQKYSGKFTGTVIEQKTENGCGNFYIKGKYSEGYFRITSPGFSKINIDITYANNSQDVNTKRITLEPHELETGLLEDLMEQFISEYKN